MKVIPVSCAVNFIPMFLLPSASPQRKLNADIKRLMISNKESNKRKHTYSNSRKAYEIKYFRFNLERL